MPEATRRVPWADVVQVAAKKVREEGAAGLDIEAIATSLGTTPAAVRYWFSTETDLLLSVMQMRQRWFVDQADSRFSRAAGNTQKLRELIELCVADSDVTYWIELWRLARRDEHARAERQLLTGHYRDLFARLIRNGQRTGEFGSASPDQVALVLVAMVVGLSVEVTVHGDVDPDRMRAILTNACERLLEVDLSPA